jgi:ABC-2 type transport system ATP-binding protein
VRRFTGHKRIMVKPQDHSADLSGYGEIISQEAGVVSLRVPREEISKVTATLLAEVPIIDLLVEDPPIEDVIETVFAEGDDEANA